MNLCYFLTSTVYLQVSHQLGDLQAEPISIPIENKT